MILPTPKPTWDVVIVASFGRAFDLGYLLLRAHLVKRALRVNLIRVTKASLSPMPGDLERHAAGAAYCVVLAATADAARSSQSLPGEEFLYALLPAPKFSGQEPKHAPPHRAPLPGEIEMGTIRGDFGDVASRIAERIRIPGR